MPVRPAMEQSRPVITRPSWAWKFALAVGSAVACAPTAATVVEPTAEAKPPAASPPIEDVLDAFNQPGCAGLYEMFAPHVTADITAELTAEWCRIMVGSLGRLTGATEREPPHEPDSDHAGFEYYRVSAERGSWSLSIRYEEATGRIRDLYLVEPVVERCRVHESVPPPAVALASRYYADISREALPGCATVRSSMDAEVGDLDGDGDLDVVVAVEFGPNLVLINDGRGRFTDEAKTRLEQPDRAHDTEDIALADLDGDGDLDIVFVSEDDKDNQLYLNDGRGRFRDASAALGVAGVSNAVAAGDVDGDGDVDLLIGNAGQNELLLGDGRGGFTRATETHLPQRGGTTQDVELGDVDGDGDLDAVIANETDAPNRLLLNERGVFRDAPLPAPPDPEETREADFGDVDGDGDLDLLFANVGEHPKNRLLIGDGAGQFVDETAQRLPTDLRSDLDGDLMDLDRDGDLDVITASWDGFGFKALLNDGAGVFTEDGGAVFPRGIVATGVDVELADFDGDGLGDLYLCDYRDSDFVLRGTAP